MDMLLLIAHLEEFAVDMQTETAFPSGSMVREYFRRPNPKVRVVNMR